MRHGSVDVYLLLGYTFSNNYWIPITFTVPRGGILVIMSYFLLDHQHANTLTYLVKYVTSTERIWCRYSWFSEEVP